MLSGKEPNTNSEAGQSFPGISKVIELLQRVRDHGVSSVSYGDADPALELARQELIRLTPIDLAKLSKQRAEARRIVRVIIAAIDDQQSVGLLNENSAIKSIAALELVLSLSLGSDAETHQIMLEALRKITTAARSWHDFHHGDTIVQCDEICAALPTAEAAIRHGEGQGQ